MSWGNKIKQSYKRELLAENIGGGVGRVEQKCLLLDFK